MDDDFISHYRLHYQVSYICALILLLIPHNRKMFDVLWMMFDVLRDVRCMMAEGRRWMMDDG